MRLRRGPRLMPLTRIAMSVCVVLSICLSTGCASSTEDYCDALGDQEKALTDLAGNADDPKGDLFGDSLEIFEDLRDQAPNDIVDEWDTLVFAWEGAADAFEEAGVSPQDYKPGDTSGDVTKDEARAIGDAARELGSSRVVDAGDGIEQHASDVCKVDLGL